MNVFEKTFRDLFRKTDILWDPRYTGKTCISRLDRNLLVKLFFIEQWDLGQFDAICVCIINRTGGLIDQQIFCFQDMVPERMGEHNTAGYYPYVELCAGDAKWHDAPLSLAEQKLIRNAILNYVEAYLDIDQPMRNHCL